MTTNPFRPPTPRAGRGSRGTAKLDRRDVETTERWIEVTIAWGEGAVLHVAHLRDGETLSLGDEPAEGTYVVGREALGMSRLPLVSREGDRVRVSFPEGASVERAGVGGATGADGPSRGPSPGLESLWLEPGTSLRIRHRALVLTVREVMAGRRVGKTRPPDWAFLGEIAMVACVFAGLLLVSSLAPPRAGALGAPALDPSNRYVRHAILMAEGAEREASVARPVDAPEVGPDAPTDDRRRPWSPARTSVRPTRGARAPGGPLDWRERARATVVAETLRGLARAIPGGSGFVPSAPGGSGPGGGPGWGLFGGLDQSLSPSTRSGASGTVQAELDRIPVGDASAATPGDGRRRAGRVPGPVVRLEVDEGAGLEREIVRRVVRRNEARVRFCYERSLQGNPDLAGRVAVRFVIGPSGAVQGASVLHSEVGREVGECIASAVRRMSFPSPEQGVVAVNYAWIFQAP